VQPLRRGRIAMAIAQERAVFERRHNRRAMLSQRGATYSVDFFESRVKQND